MPEKPRAERAKRAKARGVPVAVKEKDVTGLRHLSSHAAKKSGGIVARAGFDDRSTSMGRSPGMGKTHRSKALPVPDDVGSTTQRRKTVPTEAAAAYRKSGTRKKTPEASAPDVRTPPRKRFRAGLSKVEKVTRTR